MSKNKRPVITDDFKKEAVRLIVTSGRTISQIAADLGVGLSTLTRWKRQFHEANLLAGPHEDMTKELARLRKREVDEVQTHRCCEEGIPRLSALLGSWCQ